MPDAHEDIAAWLEDADRKSHPIRGACSLGRSASNQVPLPDERVSRRHAVIQSQLEDEFGLVDFGSRNGSYVNDIRVAQPTRLRNGDVGRIGPFQLVFRQQAASDSSASPTLGSSLTVTDFKLETYWLLVADIIDSSKLAQQLPRDELPLVTGRWVSECKQTIESVGGRINQFMGDGFFACWRDHDRIAVSIHKAIEALLRLQQEAKPAFRFVVHLGDVTIGGVSVGEEAVAHELVDAAAHALNGLLAFADPPARNQRQFIPRQLLRQFAGINDVRHQQPIGFEFEVRDGQAGTEGGRGGGMCRRLLPEDKLKRANPH